MIKRIFLYIAVLLFLAGCADDLYDSPGGLLASDGEVSLSFSVPEMTDPLTRGAAEEALLHVDMLVYDGDVLSQTTRLTDVVPGERLTVTIDEGLRKKGNLIFVFIANFGGNAGGYNLSDLKRRQVGDVIDWSKTVGDDKGVFVMSGISSLQSLLRLEPVKLFRNASKFTVREWKNNAYGEDYPFAVYGEAASSPLMAGASNFDNQCKATGSPAGIDDFNRIPATGILYTHPTSNTGTDENKAFVIVKAPYSDGNEYYYRLNLHDWQTDNGPLDILPNHHYDIRILDTPRSAGYLTQEEAARNPVAKSEGWYIIHDHAPVIFNMMSDGIRELGVSHILENDDTSEKSTAVFYVKLYSRKDAAEENAFSAADISFGENWVTVSRIERVDSPEEAGIAGSGTIHEENEDGTGEKTDRPDRYAKGTVYKVTALFGETRNTGVLETVCNVTWKGLSREIPVVWNRTFDASKLYKKVIFRMKEGETVKFETDDYFAFIRGTYDEKGNQLTAPSVWGIESAANNGENRDLGMHFPMPYGDPTLWTYEYEIELNDLGEENQYTWSYSVRGDAAVTGVQLEVLNAGGTQTLAGEGPHFKLTRSAQGWEYGIGELIITVDNNPYPIPLYHTGFFHQDNLATTTKGIGLAKVAAAEGRRDWTYYEVVSMNGTHWLDRNLCAHSAGMYVETSSGSSYYGSVDAAGGYYRVAEYLKHGKPRMEGSLCPPGYTYPSHHNFNEMRASADFHTGQVGSYYTAALSADTYAGGEKRKTIYFPKALYLDANNTRAGESRAGYYWTSTAASGTEKEEIGAWLKCFNLSGEATSFINGEVYCSAMSTYGNSTRTGEVNGFAMPVRCVSKEGSEVGSTVPTSFFVKGATHVYFYTKNGAITTWPGTSIGNYNTVNKLFNVLYESAVNTPDKLYVIFNYKDRNGQVHSMSKNPDDPTTALFTTSVSPSKLQGWGVVGDDAPDYARYAVATTGTQVIDVTLTDQDEQAKAKYYWTCDFFTEKGGFGMEEGTVMMPVYRIYWHTDYGGFQGMNLFFKAEDAYGDIAYKSNMYWDDNWNVFGWADPYRYQDIPGFDWPESTPKLCLQGRWENNGWSDRQPYVLKGNFEKTTIGGNPNYYCYTVEGDVKGTGEHVAGFKGKPAGAKDPEHEVKGQKYRFYFPRTWDGNRQHIWLRFSDGTVIFDDRDGTDYTGNPNNSDYQYVDFVVDGRESDVLEYRLTYQGNYTQTSLSSFGADGDTRILRVWGDWSGASKPARKR